MFFVYACSYHPGLSATTPPPSILLIEDSATVRSFATAILSHAGYRVRAAACASEGLSALRDEQSDIVLLDVGLPDAAFDDLIADIRQHTQSGHTLLLLHSGKPASELAVLAQRHGVHGYLEKSHRPKLLLRYIEGAWNQHLQRQLDESESITTK